METLFTILATGVISITSFFIGSYVGSKTNKGEPIELPKLDPLQPIRERQGQKQAKEEQEKYNAILRNIENYDGTSRGQEDVPRR